MNDLIIPHQEIQPSLPRPIGSPADMLIFHDHMTQLIRDVLKKDTDYGIIPGTSKPTLFKPGAERINMAFGTRPEYILMEKEVDHYKEVTFSKGASYGVYRYVYKCLIVKQGESHHVIGEGIGSASSFESKYISRPRDLENTILKMAMKRAYLSATLSTFGLSERFAQMLSAPAKPQLFNSNDPHDADEFLTWLDKSKIKLTVEESQRAMEFLHGKSFSQANDAVKKAKETKE